MDDKNTPPKKAGRAPEDAPPRRREPIVNTPGGGLAPYVPVYRIAPSSSPESGITASRYGPPAGTQPSRGPPAARGLGSFGLSAPRAPASMRNVHSPPGLLLSRFANPAGAFRATTMASTARAAATSLSSTVGQATATTTPPSRPAVAPSRPTAAPKLDASGWPEDGSPITVEGSAQGNPPPPPLKKSTESPFSAEQQRIFQEANRLGQQARRTMQEHMAGSTSKAKEAEKKQEEDSDEEL